MRGLAIGTTRLSARTFRRRDPRASRERRLLPPDRTPRRLELDLQFLVLASKPLPLRFRPTQVLAQSVDLSALLLDDLLRITRRRHVIALWHVPVMPDSRAKYKREMRAGVR